MKIIALMTDFGDRDGYPGIMKGVIWSIAPNAQIADLTHQVEPQDILAGALTLARAWKYYPEGTVFVGVVDPGVGTGRRAIAARIGTRYFVGPDNGLLTISLEQAETAGEPVIIVQLDQAEFWLPNPSRSFHGRDIFAPVAAHIVNGAALEKLGTVMREPVRLTIPQPTATVGGWQAPILHVDHFGNLATGLQIEALEGQGCTIHFGDTEIPLVLTFGDRGPGSLVAMIDSSGYLAVCVVNGNAAQRLKAKVGDMIDIRYRPA